MPSLDMGVDVGIDLGTSVVKIYTPDRGIVLKEPAVVAVDRDTGEIIAIGTDAYRMLGRTSDRVAVVYPLKDGVISDYDLAEAMLTALVRLVCGNKIFMPRVVVCVPIGITEVERRAVVDALRAAGARKVCLIDEVIAAALGAGLDISQPYGQIVCDVGGGTADVGIISLNNAVVSTSVKHAGNKIDDAIIKQVRKDHNLIIGLRTAENIKKEIGGVVPRDKLLTSVIKGRDARSGMPRQAEATSDELIEAIEEQCIYICRAIQSVIEETPPELVADLYDHGLVLTGGSAMLYGLDKMISRKTRLNVYIAHDPQSCVVSGTGKALSFIDTMDQMEIATSPLDIYSY